MADGSHPQQVTAADERRHKAEGTSAWWGESWGFDFATRTADGEAIGGFTRIAVYPRQQKCWFWAGIVGENRAYVLCRDHDLALPTTPVLELRGGSLWTHAICETPLEHWTVAMEAYALSFDDPFEAWRSEHGDRIGLAFDLEWETLNTAARFSSSAHVSSTRYDVPCEVNGILQVGDDEWTIAATGSRHHEWGILDWSAVGPYRRENGSMSEGSMVDTSTVEASTVEGNTEFVAEAPLQIETSETTTKRLLFTLEQPLDNNPAMRWREALVEPFIDSQDG
jgi:hypothetical protein